MPKNKKLYTNLILDCNHILYGVEYHPLDHRMGEEAWCPTCGATCITEAESPYTLSDDELSKLDQLLESKEKI